MTAIGEFLLFPFFFIGRVAGIISQVIQCGWEQGRRD